MNFDLRTLLEMITDDEAMTKPLLERLETEGMTAELMQDVGNYLQARLDKSLDAAGVPPLDEDDPALEAARAEAAETTQAALEQLKEAQATFQSEVSKLEQKIHSELDEIDADAIRQNIAS